MCETTREVACEWCGESLTEEEIDTPSDCDDRICEECFFEHYRFTCHFCQGYEDKEKECAIGTLFAIWEPTPAREPYCLDGNYPDWFDFESRMMLPGIYRITQWPMYWDGVIEAGLYASAFERVGDLTKEMQDQGGYAGYSCGPLCGDCGKKFSSV